MTVDELIDLLSGVPSGSVVVNVFAAAPKGRRWMSTQEYRDGEYQDLAIGVEVRLPDGTERAEGSPEAVLPVGIEIVDEYRRARS